MDKVITSLTVLLTGFLVVFIVLFLLIAVIVIYAKVVSAAEKKSKEAKAKKAEKAKAANAQTVAKIEEATQAPVEIGQGYIDDEISEEVIAVIAAAVDSMYAQKGGARIKGIKKSSNSRNAWGIAGIQNNTRPF